MEQQKAELKKKIMDEQIFGPIVDKTFQEADKNSNGFVEKKELGLLIKKIRDNLGFPPPTEKDIKNEMKRLDKNKDGKLSKEEFRVLVKEITMFSIDQLQ